MDFLTAELRAGELAPVLLGNSNYTKTVSKHFFERHGIISHIFCARMPFWGRFSLTAKHHTVAGFENDELLLIALLDFAAGAQNKDVILFLIPGTDSAGQFIRRNRERLEPHFVLADAQSLSELIG